MSAPAWLRARDDRCSRCGCHLVLQGHCAPCAPSGPLGEQLAREGMAAATAAHPSAVVTVDAAIMRAVQSGRPFSANTIRGELSSLSPSERPVIGARMNALARKHCRKVGEEPSTDAATHGKAVSVWQAAA